MGLLPDLSGSQCWKTNLPVFQMSISFTIAEVDTGHTLWIFLCVVFSRKTHAVRDMLYKVHRKKKVREFPVPIRDVTTKLSLGGNNDVITELFLSRGVWLVTSRLETGNS